MADIDPDLLTPDIEHRLVDAQVSDRPKTTLSDPEITKVLGAFYDWIKRTNDELAGIPGAPSSPVGIIEQWCMLNDVCVQFSGGVNGINGPAVDNAYNGTVGTATRVYLVVSDGDGTTSLVNSTSTVQVSISGGGAAGKKINGGAGPVTVTFTNGQAYVDITVTGAGTVTLALANPTHPSVTLVSTDTATVTFV